MAAKRGKKGGGKTNFQKMWQGAQDKAKALSSYIEEPMTGRFKIDSVGIETIGDNDWQHVALHCVCVEEGENEGKLHTHRGGIMDEQQLAMTQRDLALLGFDLDEAEPDSIDEFEDALQDLVGTVFRAKLRPSKREGFLDMRIQKVLEDEPEEEEEEPEEEEEEPEEEEEEPEEEDIAVGDRVSWKYRKRTLTGEVTEVKPDGKLRVKREDNNRVITIGADDYERIDDDEEEEEEEEEAEIVKGSNVVFTDGDTELEGVVQSINEKKGTVKVLFEGEKKARTVDAEKLEALVF